MFHSKRQYLNSIYVEQQGETKDQARFTTYTIPIPTAKKNKDTELRCLFKGFEYVLEQKM